MMPSNQISGLLGLARRARKLTTGTNQVLTRVRAHATFLVVLASDCGSRTKKTVADKCRSFGIPLVTPLTQAELSAAIGQQRSVVAVDDAGFAKKITALAQQATNQN